MELLDQELDMKAADAAKKMFDKEMFLYFWYHATGWQGSETVCRHSGCFSLAEMAMVT